MSDEPHSRTLELWPGAIREESPGVYVIDESALAAIAALGVGPRRPAAKAVRRKTQGRPSRWDVGSFQVPEEVDTPEVRAALASWLEYKKADSFKGYVNSAWITAAANACRRSPGLLVASIEHSIARGWRGIYPRRDHGRGDVTLSNPQFTRA